MDTKFKVGDKVVLTGTVKEVNPTVTGWVDGMNSYSIVPDTNPTGNVWVREDYISLLDEDDLK